MRKLLDYLVLALAVYRLTYMVREEEGPYMIFDKLHEYAGVHYYESEDEVHTFIDEENGYNFLGRLLSCFYCTSIYVSAILTLLSITKLKPILVVLAMSQLSIFIHEREEGSE